MDADAAGAMDADGLAEALEYAGQTGERPDGLPDQFWNPDANSVRWDSVVKVIKDQQRAIRSNSTEVPDDYAVELNDEARAMLLGDESEDPLLQMALQWARDTGQSQEGFTRLLQGFEQVAGHIHSNQPTQEQRTETLLQGLAEQYGNANRAKAAVHGLSNFINATLPDENDARAAAVEFAKHPHGFAVLDTFRAAMRDRAVPTQPARGERLAPRGEYQELAQREVRGELSPAEARRKAELREYLDARPVPRSNLTTESTVSLT